MTREQMALAEAPIQINTAVLLARPFSRLRERANRVRDRAAERDFNA